MQQQQGKGAVTRIGELRPGAHGLRCEFVVVERLPSRPTNDGTTIHSFLVADATGCIVFNIWGVQGAAIEPADIFVLHDGYAAFFREQLTLYMGKRGRLERVGRFTMLFSEAPNMSLLPPRAFDALPAAVVAAAQPQQPLLIPPPQPQQQQAQQQPQQKQQKQQQRP